MRRFFVSQEEIKHNTVQITGSNAHHISKVLRLEAGELIIVFDGTGLEYQVEISTIDGEFIEGKIIGKFSSTRDPNVEITLIQGIPKGDKMELIIQKCTELGITRIIPVLTERSVVKIEGEKKKKREGRWQKIAQEAAKQCRRSTVPEVTEILTWNKLLEKIAMEENLLVFWEEEEAVGLKTYLQNKGKINRITYFIGPEGGLSSREVADLKDKQAETVSLGKRILRTETAGFAALTMILYELGDLG